MEGLREYAALATDDMKKAVREAGKTVKQEISSTAPRDTGAYAKSWAIKSVKETSDSLEVVVHSKSAIALRTFWSTVMPSEAAAGLSVVPILRPPNRRASSS